MFCTHRSNTHRTFPRPFMPSFARNILVVISAINCTSFPTPSSQPHTGLLMNSAVNILDVSIYKPHQTCVLLLLLLFGGDNSCASLKITSTGFLHLYTYVRHTHTSWPRMHGNINANMRAFNSQTLYSILHPIRLHVLSLSSHVRATRAHRSIIKIAINNVQRVNRSHTHTLQGTPHAHMCQLVASAELRSTQRLIAARKRVGASCTSLPRR